MIAIIDYGGGNLGSVAKAFKALGAKVQVTQNPKDLDKAGKIVLPGVGAFYDAILSLKRLRLIPPLVRNIKNGKPYLGLCLGMQLLFETSEEDGRHKGLGILEGRVKRFSFKRNTALKVPHMGWNQIRRLPAPEGPSAPVKDECPLLKEIPDGAWMYFVHSYYVAPKDKGLIAAATDYGVEFASMLWKDNIYATQFHPEKSQGFGMRILENFVGL